MIKDRLRDLNIKLTELSDYVKISRPTLYKYIESYDSGDFKSIRTEILALFRYLEEPGLKKEQALTYMISISSENSSDDRDVIRNYLLNPSASDTKVEFIRRIVTSQYLDELLPYLNNCIDILSKDRIDNEELHQVARLAVLKSKVTKNVQLSPEELAEAVNALGVKYDE